MELRKLKHSISVHHEMRYWKWETTEEVISFDHWVARDFVVLLPKIGMEFAGEYTMVSKEWSPAMLEHYEYSKVGIVKNECFV